MKIMWLKQKLHLPKQLVKKKINQQDLYLIKLNMKFLRMLLRMDLVQKDLLSMVKIKKNTSYTKMDFWVN
jgi:hypothetical protein